jgi:hypothetical protein
MVKSSTQQQKSLQHASKVDDDDRRNKIPPVGRSRPMVSLNSFAQKRGQIRALEEFKKRKQYKRLETAKALRRYQKVMKQEGMAAGKGASRKRRPEEEEEEEDNEKEKNTSIHEELDPQSKQIVDVTKTNGEGGSHISKKRPKTNPLAKSVIKAQQVKQHAALQAQQKEKQTKERQRKLRQRQQQSKLLQQRTKRGQPIMKHLVNNLLQKLEKQQQQQQQNQPKKEGGIR